MSFLDRNKIKNAYNQFKFFNHVSQNFFLFNAINSKSTFFNSIVLCFFSSLLYICLTQGGPKPGSQATCGLQKNSKLEKNKISSKNVSFLVLTTLTLFKTK